MPFLNDREGSTVPAGLPAVVDAHVHIFPNRIFRSIRRWFDDNAWHIRYQLTASEIIDFLLSRGVKHVIALQYAHKPGIAEELNDYMAEKCRQFPHRVTGLATLFPGEDNAESILQKAFDDGLGGLKLHAHVQCFEMNAAYMHPVYACCQANQKPIVMHVGREPKSPAYGCDPYRLCSAERLERILNDFPKLKICVPHLGFDEISAYKELIERYDTLWLDTSMAITDYFAIPEKIGLNQYRSDRVMYGSDFPNLPYAWDRELAALKTSELAAEALENITSGSAVDFFNIKL